ncbi:MULTISPECIES: DUF2934 domain-containing protein [unclassified Rhizobium]|uniref:DUF2934 domain-containing protein n=1 Tax=unclassified Rhizobium TaxID=2613769 RepID=UPI000DDEEC69|nr:MULTISPECIES: DUF2934 domain-containing protein [unclassified Rhizobium]MBB3447094.1 hypothetical protein [Rhizobium sp. BK379]MBB3565622.1 hypothetical protein [Rhizobium sp. BK512]
MDREQQRRERAYKIWEDEGRPDGQHADHWRRAEEQHEATEKEAADVTEANQNASDEFNGDNGNRPVTDIRPPSTVTPD